MATITWYGDGTATVAVSSRTVTGTNTGWLTEVAGLTPIKAGDKFGIHVGRPIVIEKIISNTELLLADDWPGPAQTDEPYKVELTSPTIAAVEAMRRLLASLSNGNLESLSEISVGTDDIPIGIGPGVFGTISRSTLSGMTASLAALASLTPAPNKLPYFTGENSAEITDLSAFARTILDDGDGASMFASMGAAQSYTTSGWAKLPSGLIFQWGFVPAVTGGNLLVPLPITFPNALLAVTVNNTSTPANMTTLFNAWADELSASSITIRGRIVSNGGAVGTVGLSATYFVVGY